MDSPALFAFALCNTVLPHHKEHGIMYQAESPDEIAFVDTAALYGLRLVSKEKDFISYEYQDDVIKF